MKAIKYLICIFHLTFQPTSAQNFWQQTNGPYGGATVNDFLLYDDSTIFLATDEGIIKSSDNGETWNRNPVVWDKVSCLASDKFGILYAGIKDDGDNTSLYKSTDGGSDWYIMSTGFGTDIKDIIINYTDTIIVGSWSRGLYRSFDCGINWIRINNGIQYTGIYEIILLSNGSLLVGTSGGGVYKSTNWGDLWTPSGNFVRAESFCETSPGNIFTGTSTGIYYSSNYGGNWAYRGDGIPYINTAKCIVADNNGNLYAGIDISKGVYYSTNNGIQWQHLGLGSTTYTLGWDNESRLNAGGLSSGLYRYTFEDSSWVSVYSQGYTPVQVNHLWITDSGNLIAGTQGWGLKYSTNSGTTWKTINDPAGFYAIETINDNIFIGAGFGNIYVSNDTGKTWSVTGNISFSALYYEPTSQIIYAGSYPNLTTPCGIYTSGDFGQSWELIHTFQIYTENQWIDPILITKTNQVILASVGYSSQFGQYSRIYKSTDFGQTWEIIVQDNGYFPQQIIEDDSLNIFVLTGHSGTKLLVSTDEGETWIIKNIPQTECIASDYSGRLYRAFINEIWYTIDMGNTWTEVNNSGLSGIGIYDVVINQNNRIFLATTGGVYFGEGDSIVVSVEDVKPVKTFRLSQNYPNPFNPSTKIKFEIPDQVRNDNHLVTLKVYDVLGNEIVTLVNEEKQPGTYEVEFNTSTIKHLPSSGIYFYQLKAGNFVETKKMILLK